jgi:y4mF family transcriptional regulator
MFLYPIGYKVIRYLDYRPDRVYNMRMNRIAAFMKANRKAAGLTQAEFAVRSGLGLRFIRELEQGKQTVRMDKVNQALAMFGMEAVPGRKDET